MQTGRPRPGVPRARVIPQLPRRRGWPAPRGAQKRTFTKSFLARFPPERGHHMRPVGADNQMPESKFNHGTRGVWRLLGTIHTMARRGVSLMVVLECSASASNSRRDGKAFQFMM